MSQLAFLRELPYFSDLTDDDIERLCGEAPERVVREGESLIREGETSNAMYLVSDGEFEVTRDVDGRDVVIGVTGPNEPLGEMALLQGTTHSATATATTDSRVIEIGRDVVEQLLANPRAAAAMMRTVVLRLRSTEERLRESVKQAALGRLTAGLMHELNNPAAAAQRAASRLASDLDDQQAVALGLTGADDVTLGDRPEDPLERSDLEHEVAAWLRDAGMDGAHDLAPSLVASGWSPRTLDQFVSEQPADAAQDLVRWLALTCSTADLADEIRVAATRISELVAAVKRYSYADSAPVQDVSVNDSLRDTLVLMRHALGSVEVETRLDRDLPTIEAFGAELNQVWTNLIDNALGAMGGEGRLELRTRREGSRVVVEVADSGPGIPPDIQERIFEPFFTTKGPGDGTGVGLATVYEAVRRHGGDITVESRPGNTCFQVVLPTQLPRPPA